MDMVERAASGLTGAALDWAVAMCEGEPVVFYPVSHDDPRPYVLHTTDGRSGCGFYRPSADWELGGPLIEKYRVGFMHLLGHKKDYGLDEAGNLRNVLTALVGYRRTLSGKNAVGCDVEGRYLLAACRAIVVARLGETVQVPAALVVAEGQP